MKYRVFLQGVDVYPTSREVAPRFLADAARGLIVGEQLVKILDFPLQRLLPLALEFRPEQMLIEVGGELSETITVLGPGLPFEEFLP